LREKGLQVECVSLLGIPKDEILKYAVKHQVQLIALSTHGHHGLRRIVSGSVADAILRESGLPMLVIRPEEARAHRKTSIPTEEEQRSPLFPSRQVGVYIGTYNYRGKSYTVDDRDFLKDFNSWDEDFAEGMAQRIGMPNALTKEQWDVIHSIRDTYRATGRCPNIYETCRMCGLRLREFRKFFPTGYLRGACRLAGVTYQEGSLGETNLPVTAEDIDMIAMERTYNGRTYKVDVRGFLIDPDDWDEHYAIHMASETKIPGGKLTDGHWKIIRFLRESYQGSKYVPTVYETCEKNEIDLEELEQLFPDGYHRGAIRIAGLRLR